jgi:glycosyltransferase involved in cell wall biosynthesis
MQFSLLLATVGRTDDLARFFRSLCEQTHKNFQVIVIDQNEDNRVSEVLSRFEGQFSVLRLRSARGLSRARNLGLAYATGDVIAFPDDDCWYQPDVLEKVARILTETAALGGITGSATAGTWSPLPGPITRFNAWRRGISFSMFLRRAAVGPLLFDEALGLGAGTPWGSGEETDFLLRMLETGASLEYRPEVQVNHPQWDYRAVARSKQRSYGRGMGRLLRKHKFPLHLVGYHIVRPLAASVLGFFSGGVDKAAYHYECCVGRIEGWAGIGCSPESALL